MKSLVRSTAIAASCVLLSACIQDFGTFEELNLAVNRDSRHTIVEMNGGYVTLTNTAAEELAYALLNGSASISETVSEELAVLIVESSIGDDDLDWQAVADILAGGDPNCIDSDGDGWGWNGHESCMAALPDPAIPRVCKYDNGDGWGWNGVESCRIEDDPAELPIVEADDQAPVVVEEQLIDPGLDPEPEVDVAPSSNSDDGSESDVSAMTDEASVSDVEVVEEESIQSVSELELETDVVDASLPGVAPATIGGRYLGISWPHVPEVNDELHFDLSYKVFVNDVLLTQTVNPFAYVDLFELPDYRAGCVQIMAVSGFGESDLSTPLCFDFAEDVELTLALSAG